MLYEIYKKEQMPKKWSLALVCPLYKKGDKKECQNYTSISLSNIVYNIMAMHIKNKLIERAQQELEQY